MPVERMAQDADREDERVERQGGDPDADTRQGDQPARAPQTQQPGGGGDGSDKQ